MTAQPDPSSPAWLSRYPRDESDIDGELAYLRGCYDRAREIYAGTLDTSHQLGPIGVATARYILGEEPS